MPCVSTPYALLHRYFIGTSSVLHTRSLSLPLSIPCLQSDKYLVASRRQKRYARKLNCEYRTEQTTNTVFYSILQYLMFKVRHDPFPRSSRQLDFHSFPVHPRLPSSMNSSTIIPSAISHQPSAIRQTLPRSRTGSYRWTTQNAHQLSRHSPMHRVLPYRPSTSTAAWRCLDCFHLLHHDSYSLCRSEASFPPTRLNFKG